MKMASNPLAPQTARAPERRLPRRFFDRPTSVIEKGERRPNQSGDGDVRVCFSHVGIV